MTTKGKIRTVASETADRELSIKRTFDAPRAVVYQAWTEAKRIAAWCAPRGYTVIHSEGDLRPGGAWRSCMRSPDGQELWLGGVYREVVPQQKLVFTHAWDSNGRPGHETLVRVELEDHAGETRMNFEQGVFESVEERDGHRGGWVECFDRLDDYLERLHDGGTDIRRRA
jgi:uncharacterized protein YndB with AHSA1/START domain